MLIEQAPENLRYSRSIKLLSSLSSFVIIFNLADHPRPLPSAAPPQDERLYTCTAVGPSLNHRAFTASHYRASTPICRAVAEKRKEQAAGKPAIGGPFELFDFDSKPFSSDDLKGNWTILYFGFTFCPDVCPDELDKLSEAITIMVRLGGWPSLAVCSLLAMPPSTLRSRSRSGRSVSLLQRGVTLPPLIRLTPSLSLSLFA